MNGLDQEYGDKVEVRYVNVDDPGNRRLVSRYGARTIPHIVILNDSGGVTATFVGVTPKETLRKAIERALLESPLDAG